MSIVKTSVAAVAVVLSLAGVASAATRHHEQARHVRVHTAPVYGAYDGYGSAYTYDALPSPSGDFQDQWKNTY